MGVRGFPREGRVTFRRSWRNLCGNIRTGLAAPFRIEFIGIGCRWRTAIWINDPSLFIQKDDAVHFTGQHAPGKGRRDAAGLGQVVKFRDGFVPVSVRVALERDQVNMIYVGQLLPRGEAFIAHCGAHEPEQAHRRHEHGKQQERDRPDIACPGRRVRLF